MYIVQPIDSSVSTEIHKTVEFSLPSPLRRNCRRIQAQKNCFKLVSIQPIAEYLQFPLNYDLVPMTRFCAHWL